MSKRTERAVPKAPVESKATPIDWRRHGFVALGLFALVLAAYVNCFQAGLIFDNKPILLEDPRIQAATSQNIGEIWSRGYWYLNQDPTLYRPLTTLSYLFNYAILGNGANPAGYHWVNLILHAVNALLVYALGLVLFRKTAPAVAMAALWAVHPVLTESVTNIVGRADILSALGVLAGLLCHVKAPAATGSRRVAWLAGLAAASATGIFSKESAVVLLLLMLVYDLTFRRAEWRTCLAGYACAAAPLPIYFYMRAQALASAPVSNTLFVNNPLLGAGFLASRLTAIRIIGRYLFLLLWPASLSCDYSYNQIPLFQGWQTALALAVCLGAAGFAAWSFRRNKPAFFSIALFFIALAPVANIALLIGTIMAERLLYLPAVGFAGIAVWALYAAADRFGVPAPRVSWALGVICLVLAVRTEFRNADWENGLTLWSSAAAAVPHNFKAHQNLAVELFRDPGSLDRVLAEDGQALAILKGLSAAQEDAMMYADAGAHLRTKGDRAGDQGRVWYQKAREVLLHGEAVDRAVTEAQLRANRLAGRDPGRLGAYLLYQELGQTELRLGDPQKAVEALEYGLSISITPEFLQLLSEAHAAGGDRDGAAVALMEGVLIYPDRKGFASELLKLYQGWNPPTCAVDQSAASLNVACPLVHNHLCSASAVVAERYTRRGQTMEAEKMKAEATQSLGCR